MTKEELKNILIIRLLNDVVTDLVWGDLTTSVQSSSEDHKLFLLKSIKEGNHAAVGRIIDRIIKNYFHPSIEAQVDAMLIDDSLTIEEINKVIG